MNGDSLDTTTLFGSRVVDRAGRRLGRVIAVVHRGDGCDVLVERRRWLGHTVRRLDLDDLVQRDQRSYCHRPAQRIVSLARGGSGDGRVA